MGFTKFTKNVLNVSALPDRVQNQASSLKLVFDQAGVDIKAALNALISELEAKVAAANIGADVASVTEKNVQGILTAFENEIANRYTKAETNNAILADTNELIADVKIDLATGLLTVTKKNGTKQTFETSTEAESYAVGGTGTRPGEDTDNAKYYAQIAKQVAGGDFVTVVEMEGYAQKKGLYPNYDETELKGEVIETETTLEAESTLKLYGNSTQETRSGRNKIKITISSHTVSGVQVTVNDDKSITLNGTHTGASHSFFRIGTDVTLPAGTYTLSNYNANANTNSFIFYDNGENFSVFSNNVRAFTSTVTVKPYLKLCKGVTYNNETIYPTVIEGSYTVDTMPSYEPYGVMPSPEFESPIMSVSGDVEARVEGSNELNLKSFTYGYCSVAPTLNNGTISVTGSNNADYPNKGASRNGFIGIHAIDEWETGATYYISCDIEVTSNQKNLDESYFSCMLGGEGAYLFQLTKTANGKRYTGKVKISKPLDKLSIEFRVDGFGLNISNFMVSKQETYVYEPYKLTTIPLPLGDIELRSTPDGTRDTFVRVDGVWNKVNNVGSTVFNGSESWGFVSNSVVKFRIMINGAKALTSHESIPPNIYCQFFKTTAWYDAIVETIDEVISVAPSTSDASKTIRIKYNEMADLATFKAWLSAHPMEVIYPLATPTYTPITDPALISALDELEQLVLHKGYNRITVTGVNGVKAQLELEIAPTALTTNISETEAGLNMPVPVVSEAGDVLVKVPKAENQMTINPATGVVNVKGLTINGVSLDAYIRSIIG